MKQPSVLSRLRVIWHDTATAGAVLPSEDALAQELGASKPTVREAMIRLEAEGLVRRAQGAGTFPNLAALDMTARLDRRIDYSQQLAEAGFEPAMEVISAQLVTVDDRRAELMTVPAGWSCFETVKRWRADGVPVMVAVDLVPLRESGRPGNVRLADQLDQLDPALSVLLLADKLGPGSVEWISTWPGAVNADAEMSGLLDIEPDLAVLTLEHIGVGRQGVRCFHAFEYHSASLVRYGLTVDARARD